MTILRRIEQRWAHWMLSGIREHHARVENGLRFRLYELEQTNQALESSFVHLLNAHMDLSKDYDEVEAIAGILRQHAEKLAHQAASDCQRADDCMGCQWADSCRVAEYYNDSDIR